MSIGKTSYRRIKIIIYTMTITMMVRPNPISKMCLMNFEKFNTTVRKKRKNCCKYIDENPL